MTERGLAIASPSLPSTLRHSPSGLMDLHKPRWPKRCLTPSSLAKGNAILPHTLCRLRKLGVEMAGLTTENWGKEKHQPPQLFSCPLSQGPSTRMPANKCICNFPICSWGCQQGILVSPNVGRAKLNVKEAKVPSPGCIFPLAPAPSLAVPFAWRSGAGARLPRPPWWAVRLEMSSKDGSCSQKDMSERPHKKRVATIFARETWQTTALASPCLLKL